MRFYEFKDRTDEIAPLAAIAPIAGTAARVGVMGARAIGSAAGTAGKAAAKLGAQGAKAGVKAVGQAGKAAGKAAGNVVKGAAKGAVKTTGSMAAQAIAKKANTQMTNKLLKPGSTLPTAGGDMKVDAVKGNEITIKDPKKPKGPKLVLQKDSPEVQQGVQTLAQRVL